MRIRLVSEEKTPSIERDVLRTKKKGEREKMVHREGKRN